MSRPSLDVVHIGSAARDIAPDDPRGWRLGGGVTYASLTTARLGLRTGAVVGVDDLAAGAHELGGERVPEALEGVDALRSLLAARDEVEHDDDSADAELVSRPDLRLAHPLAVHETAVGGRKVFDRHRGAVEREAGMGPRQRPIGQRDIGRPAAAHDRALARRESRGVHYRSDCPLTGDSASERVEFDNPAQVVIR